MAVDLENLPADIVHGVHENGRENAPSGVVVGPDDQDAKRNGRQPMSGDPAEIMTTLKIGHQMKERPHEAQLGS